MDKLKLFKWYFYNGETEEDAPEYLQLLMDIMDQGFVPFSTDKYTTTSYRDSLSEFPFSFVIEKYIVYIYIWRMQTEIPVISVW